MDRKLKNSIIIIFSLFIIVGLSILLVFVFKDNKESENKQYKITFYVNQDIVKEVKTNGNEIIIAPSPLIIDGYEFIGWYFDNNIWDNQLTSDSFISSSLTNDITVYAYYEKDIVLPTEYLVSFETNGGSNIESMMTSLIETSPITTRDNYTFKGLYLDEEFTQIVNFPFEVNKEITLYAKWEQDIVEVSYNMNSSNYITGISSLPDGVTVLNIPSQINGATVIGIANGAFRSNT